MRARTLACPASLKGVLGAREAAAALAEGLRVWSEADELPVADGGDGTLEALHAALGGEWREADVHDAFGRPRRSRWLELPAIHLSCSCVLAGLRTSTAARACWRSSTSSRPRRGSPAMWTFPSSTPR